MINIMARQYDQFEAIIFSLTVDPERSIKSKTMYHIRQVWCALWFLKSASTLVLIRQSMLFIKASSYQKNIKIRTGFDTTKSLGRRIYL